MSVNEAKTAILNNKTALGIEFGSTRIKAVLVDDKYNPIASGSYEWENRYENGVWTYSLDDIHKGLQGSYSDLVKDVQEKYGVELTSVGALGISAMMHGYMPFDKDGKLLVPFRTWRNNITGEASEKLMELFVYLRDTKGVLDEIFSRDAIPFILLLDPLGRFVAIVLRGEDLY